MRSVLLSIVPVVFAVLAVGCINPLPSSLPSDTSDPAALELLAASAEAHGGDALFASVSSINVSYDGEWLNNVWKLQPMLVDREYRKSSMEHIAYGEGWPVVTQTHNGPTPDVEISPRRRATKLVRWPAVDPGRDTLDGGARVIYDGEVIEDAEIRVRQEEASAMVAEAYRMFLTGPFYFTQRAGSPWGTPQDWREGVMRSDNSTEFTPHSYVAVMSSPTAVLGAECDQVLVELRPGFGTSEVDRVEVAIDRETKYVRRVRFSLDGFRKTRGATADVEFSGFREVDGLVFPTEFLEIVVHPIDREVHRWWVTDLGVTFRDETASR